MSAWGRDGYGKLYEQTFSGSMYGSGPVVFAVWAYVVAHLRPPDGTVEINPKQLASTIGTSVEEIEAAMVQLTQPDPDSRTKTHEGRRLIQLSQFTYRAPTFAQYRNGSEDQMRTRNAERQAAWRERERKKKEQAAARRATKGRAERIPPKPIDADPPPERADGTFFEDALPNP